MINEENKIEIRKEYGRYGEIIDETEKERGCVENGVSN